MAAAPITMDKQLSVPRFRERWEAFVKEGQDKSSAQITSWLNDILQTGIAGREQADSKTLIDTLSKLGTLLSCISLITWTGSDFSWENALLALYVTLYHMPRIPLPIDLDNECSMIASKRPVDRPPVSGAERYVKELISARSPTSYLSLLPRDILRFVRLSPCFWNLHQT